MHRLRPACWLNWLYTHTADFLVSVLCLFHPHASASCTACPFACLPPGPACLPVTPQALEYVRRTLGFAPEHTVAAGDSGNDIDMLEGDHCSVVVGNAHPVLLDWAATQRKGGGQLLVARGHRALGILEGLQQWGFKA